MPSLQSLRECRFINVSSILAVIENIDQQSTFTRDCLILKLVPSREDHLGLTMINDPVKHRHKLTRDNSSVLVRAYH